MPGQPDPEPVTAAEKDTIVAYLNWATGRSVPLDIIEQAVAAGFTSWAALREEMRRGVENPLI